MGGQQAFTLIEVTIAILVLASALAVLLGLQSSLLGLSIGDRQRQDATLLARRILSIIEAAPQHSPGEQSGDGLKMLGEYVSLDDIQASEMERLRSFQVQIDTTTMGIPGLAEDALYRIVLSVSWGPAPQDRIEVLYFDPNTESIQEEPEEAEELDE